MAKASKVPPLTVAPASEADWEQVVAWAAAEGWNPGLRDAASFRPQDPDGFFVGRVGDELVSAISVVNYDPGFAFLGYYLVDPAWRGQGLGLATWRAAVPHAGRRVIGLDGVPDQQENYRRSGFATAYQTARYTGTVAPAGVPAGVLPAAQVDLAAIHAYDLRCHPAWRPAFVTRWINAPGHVAYARLRDGALAGYGVIRPSQDGYRLGPLFADGRDDAEALFDALTSSAAGAPVSVDVPETNRAAQAMLAGRGFEPAFATARMYTATPRPVEVELVFGVTSLELG